MDLSLVGVLGPFVIGAVVGILFLRMDSQKRTAKVGSSVTAVKRSETSSAVDLNSSKDVVKLDSTVLVEPLRERSPSEKPSDYSPRGNGKSDLSKCPCGLVLPDVSMWEHVMSTGHSGISSAASVKLAKIWELEEAMIEQTSPDCHKCGKPVHGLKRVGKTIYVTHVGCVSPHKPDEIRSISGKPMEAVDKPVTSRKSEKCPICWEPVSASDFVEVTSSTGNRTRFHDNCLN